MDIYTPKYVKIKNYIIERIVSGDLKSGDKIPSEHQLSEMFGVSRVTANTAIRELSTLGIVERIQGTGTFVKSENEFLNTINHDTSKSIKISSESLESRFHKLEKINVIVPNELIRKKLNLSTDSRAYEIVRLMIRNNEAIAIDYSYIPYQYFNNTEIDFNGLNKSYLHEFLSKLGIVVPKKIHIHIDAKLPSEYEMNSLNVSKDQPLVIWDTNILDENEKIVAYTTTIAVPGKYRPFINFDI